MVKTLSIFVLSVEILYQLSGICLIIDILTTNSCSPFLGALITVLSCANSHYHAAQKQLNKEVAPPSTSTIFNFSSRQYQQRIEI